MDEGKILLHDIIEDRLHKIEYLDTSMVECDNINLKELSDLLKKDIANFYQVTDNILNKIIATSNVLDLSSYTKNVTNARDLLIGKNEYNLKVNLSKEYEDAIHQFIKYLDNYLKNIDPEIANKEEILLKLNQLRKKIDNNLIINDFDFIEELVNAYDEVNFDKNMLTVMKYVNHMNLILLKMKKKNAPVFDIQMIRRPKLDVTIKEILEKFAIKEKDLPNYILSELKKIDPSEFTKTYNVIKKNKAEHGGILHLFRKDDTVGKILMLLYSTEESITGIVKSLQDSQGNVDVKTLKILVNYVPTCFYTKQNAYFNSKYNDFVANINYLKDLKVNYRALIQKNPLFMITNHEVLDYTLNYLNKCGANKKNIINRCYKILAINPPLLIDNVEILDNHGIDLEKYFGNENTNYNLLKTTDLDKKLSFIEQHSSVKDSEPVDYDLINKLLASKIYSEAKEGIINWGDV